MVNVKIYTEASYKPSKKIGVLCYIVVIKSVIVCERIEVVEKDNISINYLELKAVIHAIDYVSSLPKENHLFYIYTDNQNVQLGATTYLHRRIKTSKLKKLWITFQKKSKVYKEKLYIQLIDKNSSNIYHQRAHELCVNAISEKTIKKLKNKEVYDSQEV